MRSRARSAFPLAAALPLLLFASGAAAQEIPCGAGPCVKRQRRGTHFIAEINGGSSTYGGGGLAIGGVVGIGGKLRGFPPRFYLVSEFSYNSATESGSTPLLGIGYRDSRSFRDLAIGLRVYLPIYGPIRLFADTMFGGSHVSANLERDGMPMRAADGWMPFFLAGGGVQVRLFHHLSAGLRAKLIIGDDDSIGGLRSAVGEGKLLRSMATASLTWHF